MIESGIVYSFVFSTSVRDAYLAKCVPFPSRAAFPRNTFGFRAGQSLQLGEQYQQYPDKQSDDNVLIAVRKVGLCGAI